MSNEALREGVTRGELPAAPRWMILLPARDRESGLETAAFSPAITVAPKQRHHDPTNLRFA
jgi:hypothetical protein